ncbi:MAG: carboxypeptidase regulatory-like domain-containing protein [Longimicrobiales bacterium]
MRCFLTGPLPAQASPSPRRITAFLPYSTLAVWLCAWAATPLAAQQIRGTVLEANSGGPIADAAVAVFDDRDSQVLDVLTDSIGQFASTLRRAGIYSLRVEKIGYRTLHTDTFAIGTSEVLELRILVGIEAVPLMPLEVTARYRDSRAHPDFHRRVEWGRQTGFGRFITREEIERTAFVRTSSMLVQVPSIRLVHAPDGNVYLGVSERGTFNCRPAVYLNGMEISQSFGLDELSLDELEGVEVYRWRTEIPLELARPNVCSVVSFWTRVGTGSQTWNWRRILAGAVAIASLAMYGIFR